MGTSGADLNLTGSTTIATGQAVSISSFTCTATGADGSRYQLADVLPVVAL